MPTTMTDFTDDTAFERYVLDRVTPLMPSSHGAASVIELAGASSTSLAVTPQTAMATVSVGVTDYVGMTDSLAAAAYVPADLVRPLVVGAAWKVLDQLIELGLELAGVGHDRGPDYTIKLKTQHAAAGTAPAVPPLNSQLDLWMRATATYASTEAIRNSIVHRRLTIDPATGAMRVTPRPGERPPQDLTVSAQMAFCQVAGGVAEATITGMLHSRRAAQLRWALDQLTAHHQMSSFGATAASGLIPVVIIRPAVTSSNTMILDSDDVRARAHAAVGGVTHYDLEIHLPDGRVLTGPLEAAPGGLQTVSVDRPPAWLRWK